MESTPNAFNVVTRKCSNASAMRVTSSTLYNSWYSPHVFISKVFHSFTMYPHQLISPGRLARCQHKISTERYGQDETLIECERTVQLHFLFPTSKQFDLTKQTGQHEKGRLLFNPILYRQLEPNLPFNRMLFLPFRGTRISWIESGYHRNAMFSTDRQ